MDKLGYILEWLTKYGIIDIIFGIGIIAYIRDKFKNRVVKSIDGIEVMPRMEPAEGFFEVKIKNSTKEPFYLYRVRFKPGYLASRIDKSNVESFLRSLWFMTWVDDKFPTFYESKNTEGWYLLVGNSKKDEEAESIFLEPKEDASFSLGFDETKSQIEKSKYTWLEILKNKQHGLLRFHFVHGSSNGVFEAQI